MKERSTIRARGGFSLIEVMVATAVLMVIVLMIGAVFRQASSSWDSGYARAEGGMIVRGVIGSIERELSRAVDGRIFGNVWEYDGPVEVAKSKLAFICYKEGKGTGNTAVREPHLIEYEWAGSEMKRHDRVLKSSAAGVWTKETPKDSVVYSKGDKDSFFATFEFEAVPAVHDPNGLRPFEDADFTDGIFWDTACVKIKVDLTRADTFSSGLEVRSYGPNAVSDEIANMKDDDIVVR